MNTLFDDLRAALLSIWLRRWVALAVAWVVCLGGWVFVALIPNTYESQARIYVQLYDPLSAQLGIGEADHKRDIGQVRDTITSSVNLEKVVRATALGQGITSRKQMEGAVAGLSKAVKITSEQDNLFRISATASSARLGDAQSAKLAQDIVKQMIELFRSQSVAGVGDIQATLQFMDAQLINRQKELEAAEQRRMAFETKHPELAQGGVSLVQRLEQDRAQQRSLDGDMVAAQSALAAINGQLASTPQTVAGAGGGGLRGQVGQLQGELSAMHARGLTDNHPDVIALKNQIAALRAQISAGGEAPVGGAPNPAYATLESIRAERQANLQSLQARKGALDADIAQATAAQNTDPQLVLEAQNISRDYDVLKGQYDKMVQDREELRLRGQVESAHGTMKFQIIDPPLLPRGASAPNRPMLLALVLVAGVVAGVGVAFALGELRSTYATTAKLERAVGLPVLGAISRVVSEAGKVQRLRQVRHFVLAASALGAMFVLLVAMEMFHRRLLA
ncbi:MAG TPA: XrtA system polysaccharide chain length determinant [Novosphingobium sp.]|nr:XrtA system polysaccharide chain length determinant [Novosphingobium sp.]